MWSFPTCFKAFFFNLDKSTFLASSSALADIIQARNVYPHVRPELQALLCSGCVRFAVFHQSL